jgi:ADP-ribose pyrophosphatase YjhB (NUDIX family)
VELPVPARRVLYRNGYRVMRVVWLLTRPRVRGVKCVITDGDQILLVRHTYGSSKWDLPGGTHKRHETPAQTASREMAEELDLHISDWIEMGEVPAMIHHRRETLQCFRVEVSGPPIRIDRGEIAAARWFARSELPADVAPHTISVLARLPADPARP